MENNIKVLILSGDGINCERETKMAFENAGAKGDIVHINDLLENPSQLEQYQAMAFPGGFSFGDELGSGQILALKIRHGLMNEFKKFVAQKKPIIGICNGFQVLVKLGILSTRADERTVTLTQNRQGEFIDKWQGLQTQKSVCIWTKNLPETFQLPIRHGEGRMVLKDPDVNFAELQKQGQIALTYSDDVNGSYNLIAGICDPSGLVFGLMPHPEAYLYEGLKPGDKENVFDEAIGQQIFRNAIEYIKENRQ